MTAAQTDLDLLDDLIAKARRAGADEADAMLVRAASLDAAWRMGQNEGVERAEARDLGLRVLVGRRQAVVSATDISTPALAELVERALAMARAVPEDSYCGLPDAARIAREVPDLDLADDHEPSADELLRAASEADDAAHAVEGVTNSEGAEASWGRSSVAMCASNGFAGAYPATRFTVVASVIAGKDTAMERDYDYHSARYLSDLDAPAEIGRRAGMRAVKRLGARKQPSGRAPVVFDPRVSGGFLRLLSMSISGTAIARGTSFLHDKLGQALFDSAIDIIDDPLRKRGLASRPFDGEGVAGHRRAIVAKGRLESWLLDSRSARQLGLETTGHAARGPSSAPAPAPSNLYMEPGAVSPAALIADIASGFYVTEMMGMSFNPTTGDYSRGAAGFWIDNGAVAWPVSEMTVAGSLLELFARITPADDLTFRYGVDAPTLRVDGMTVAGL